MAKNKGTKAKNVKGGWPSLKRSAKKAAKFATTSQIVYPAAKGMMKAIKKKSRQSAIRRANPKPLPSHKSTSTKAGRSSSNINRKRKYKKRTGM